MGDNPSIGVYVSIHLKDIGYINFLANLILPVRYAGIVILLCDRARSVPYLESLYKCYVDRCYVELSCERPMSNICIS